MVINFLALGLIWAYVQRSYPSFEAARYWTGSAFMCATAAAVATLRGVMDESLLPMLAAGTIMVLATCLAAMGIRCFYEKEVNWERTALITANAFLGMGFFIYVHDSAPARLTIFTVAQALPLVLSLKMLLSPPDGRKNAGAQLAGIVVILIVTIYSLRLMAGLTGAAGGFAFTNYNQFQSLLTLVLVFLSMAVNFGFLLMAIDRLREEVANLALSDDLTGAANRRQLQKRLDEECARSNRTQEPLALLMIDIDNFKTLNDTQGHAAGDECLRMLTHSIQSRLRSGDLLVRMGGDEFCAVLPSTTLREGSIMARRVLDACRMEWTAKNCAPIPISASVGLAQWRSQIGEEPDRLIAEADRALYAAKRSGKDRYAIHEPVEAEPLRRTA